jgi:hypothetical protein
VTRRSVALAIAAFLCTAARAEPRGAAIACIYDSLGSAAVRLSAQARRDGVESPEEVVARRHFRAKYEACRNRHGWTESHAQLAVTYAVGRADGDEARDILRRHHVRDGAVEAVAASLTAAQQRAVIMDDDSTTDLLAERIIALSGFHFPARPTPEARIVMQMMSTALTGLLLERDAIARYGALAAPRRRER